jgi:hypothetical protein
MPADNILIYRMATLLPITHSSKSAWLTIKIPQPGGTEAEFPGVRQRVKHRQSKLCGIVDWLKMGLTSEASFAVLNREKDLINKSGKGRRENRT